MAWNGYGWNPISKEQMVAPFHNFLGATESALLQLKTEGRRPSLTIFEHSVTNLSHKT